MDCMTQFCHFPTRSKCDQCDFLQCKQILERLSSSYQLVTICCQKNKSICLAVYCNHPSSFSVTAAIDKQVDNCDNVTGANEILNTMSAE